MSKSKITIIVPIYNVEKYVAKCLDSLIKQTMKDFEVFAVIDGSPDNSFDIVRKYEKKDSRIKCIDKENGGYGSVLEYSIKNMKTEYFLICDPDDWLAENALEVLYNKAQETGADIVVGDKYFVYSDDNKTEYNSSLINPGVLEPNKIYRGDEVGKFVNLSVSPHSKLFKRNLATKIKFPKKVNYTDFMLYMISLSNAKSAVYIDEALSYYLVDRAGNSVTDVSIKSINSVITVFDETLKQLQEKKCKNSYLYYGMYAEARHIILNMAARLSKENYKASKKDIQNCFVLLVPYKDKIKSNIKFNKKIRTIYNKIFFSLLFNKAFRNITISFLIFCLKRKNK